MATREEILAFQDVTIEKVHVAVWNIDMHVRSLSAAGKARWEQDAFVDDAKAGVKVSRERMATARERLVELAACNEDGSRIFQDGDAKRIGQKNGEAISVLYDAAAKLSGITKKDLDEIEKNSAGNLTDASTSA